MNKDMIIDELRNERLKHAQKFKFDSALIAEDLKKVSIADLKEEVEKKIKRKNKIKTGS